MNTWNKTLVIAGISAVLAANSTAFAQSLPATSPVNTMGWRGDGNGRYPNVDPPLHWNRVSTAVKELSAQARKPADDAKPDEKSAIRDGIIRQWLLLGPIPLVEDKKPDEMLEGAPTIAPDKDDKGAGLTWREVMLDTPCMDLCALCNVKPTEKGFVAYACAYIYSPSGRSMVYNSMFQGQGVNRIWLNGESVYNSGKIELPMGPRLTLPLKKGWNRLMVLNAKVTIERATWWNSGALCVDKDPQCESSGIVWATPLPAPGSSPPVILGDRLFFTCDAGSVYCVNKADGKILWVRSLTYYDFVTEEERQANPELFQSLDVAAAKLKKHDEADAVMPWKRPPTEGEYRSYAENELFFKRLGKISKEKYGNPATYGCEAGYSPCTPATDGKFVYALFGSGIVACFDADGNCKWKRLLKHRMIEHGYATSPILVDGKLVVYLDDLTIMDPRTGDVLLERPHRSNDKAAGDNPGWFDHFYGAGCVLPAGNEKVLYYINGEFVRVRDGKTLELEPKSTRKLRIDPADYGSNGLASPVVIDGVAYKLTGGSGGVISFKLPALDGDKCQPEILREVPFDTSQHAYYYNAVHCASPLVHEGLMYCLNDFGVLTVVDMEKGEVAYQKHLDLDIFMPYNGPGNLKGGAEASPTLAGKYIYIWGNQGTCLVLEPGRTYKQVARNHLEGPICGWPVHQEATTTEPIFEGKRMYYRGEYTLYCIGPK